MGKKLGPAAPIHVNYCGTFCAYTLQPGGGWVPRVGRANSVGGWVGAAASASTIEHLPYRNGFSRTYLPDQGFGAGRNSARPAVPG